MGGGCLAKILAALFIGECASDILIVTGQGYTVIVIHLTREGIINDVNKYIRYYNGSRLHATLDYQTQNEYENPQINVCN